MNVGEVGISKNGVGPRVERITGNVMNSRITERKAMARTGPAWSPAPKGILQRKCDCGQHTVAGGECEECQKKSEMLHRHATGETELPVAPPIVHEVLRSPGLPLDPETRASMEPRFGRNLSRVPARSSATPLHDLRISRSDDPLETAADAVSERTRNHSASEAPGTGADFSDVRVHTGPQAAEAAQAVRARAFTVADHLVFNTGEYQPQSGGGQKLLAHELTHVVQQQDPKLGSTSQALQRKGGTFGGFFKNIGRAIADFFTGSEPKYGEGELRKYLRVLEQGDIEDDFDSDNKARAIVNTGMFKREDLRIRTLLIREMLSGFTGDDDEQAILTILQAASKEERETIATRIGLEKLYHSFDGEELDQLYGFYPILNSLHPRGKDESKTYTVDQYIDKWEKEHGRFMTAAEKRVLGLGCIGITALNLGTLGSPDLSNCYGTFSQALEAQQKMKDFLAAHFPTRRALLFSKRFWSGGKDYDPDPKTGKVDMSGYDYEARPGFTNFDYGLYDEKTGRWWHANHCDTTLLADPECGGSMEAYESNLKHYSRPLLDFDRQVFCVGVAIG